MPFARFLRRLGLGVFWLTSAYLLLTLLIALCEQGAATSDVYNNSSGELFYPPWYDNGDFRAAARMAVIGYPVALILFGLGALILRTQSGGVAPARPLPARTVPPVTLPPSLVLPQAAPQAFATAGTTPDTAAPDGAEHEPARPEDCCVLDSAFVIRSVGRHAAALLGVPPELLLRRPFTTFLSPSDSHALRLAADALQTVPQGPVTLHIELRHGDHIGLPVEALCRAGLGPDGQVISLELRAMTSGGAVDDKLAAVWY